MMPPDSEKLIKELSSDLKYVEPLASPMQRLVPWLLFCIIYSTILLVLFGTRYDLVSRWVSPFFTLEIITTIFSFVTALAASYHLTAPDMYQRYYFKWLPFVTSGTLALVVLSSVLIHVDFSFTNFLDEVDIRPDCSMEIAVFGIVPASYLLFDSRRGYTTHPTLAGAMVGLSSSSIGYGILRLIEPEDNPVHIFLWHLLPFTVIIFVCGIIANSLLKRSFLSKKKI